MLADGTSELPSFAARSFNLSGATRALRRSWKRSDSRIPKILEPPSTRGTSIRRMCIYWRTGHMLHRLVLKDFPEARDCLLKLRCAGHTKTFKMKKTFTEACETQVGMGERVVGFVHLHLEGLMPRFQVSNYTMSLCSSGILTPNLATQLLEYN